jgi:transposase-like protein
MLNLVTEKVPETQEFVLTLDEIAREGARRMLMAALTAESTQYVSQFAELKDDHGHAMVVKNGKAQPRNITLGSGTVEVSQPRINDRRPGMKFTSKILPPYIRKSPKVENLLPILYLKGLSTSDFKSALTEFLGEGTSGLSASSIVALKRSWEAEFEEWKMKKLTKRYVYLWADGIHISIRLGEDRRLCLLVVIGVSENGEKELLSVSSGYRESKDSWRDVLKDLRDRGLNAPLLAIGDGALGFWGALREVEGYESTQEQRCWVHKIANVLDKLPKRIQPKAKSMLHEMMRAETLANADTAKNDFIHEFHQKFPEAVQRIEKDWTELTTFFKFPAMHWQHIRTTNAIESSFATVRLRTNVTKGAGCKKAAETMTYKLLEDAQKGWRKIRGHEEIKNLLNGVAYKDGVMVATAQHQEALAACG